MPLLDLKKLRDFHQLKGIARCRQDTGTKHLKDKNTESPEYRGKKSLPKYGFGCHHLLPCLSVSEFIQHISEASDDWGAGLTGHQVSFWQSLDIYKPWVKVSCELSTRCVCTSPRWGSDALNLHPFRILWLAVSSNSCKGSQTWAHRHDKAEAQNIQHRLRGKKKKTVLTVELNEPAWKSAKPGCDVVPRAGSLSKFSSVTSQTQTGSTRHVNHMGTGPGQQDARRSAGSQQLAAGPGCAAPAERGTASPARHGTEPAGPAACSPGHVPPGRPPPPGASQVGKAPAMALDSRGAARGSAATAPRGRCEGGRGAAGRAGEEWGGGPGCRAPQSAGAALPPPRLRRSRGSRRRRRGLAMAGRPPPR